MFGYDEAEQTNIYRLYESDFKFDRTVNLLYLEKDLKIHYILIQSLKSFMRTKTRHNKTMTMCDNCLRRFSSANVYIKHLRACYSENKQFESMPEDPKFKFKNYIYRQPNILTTYAGTNRCFPYFSVQFLV